ncbi:MAG: hypothetical protein CO093_09230 [Alphaproteobacteria bacterium CG_4_9_14_3_um_filter_47_13]|nr:MAG: hypothetical protein CO093_09230 [Alphaproteobacteria bacterium CG_4_9_14_3_um_filter_47_13]
MSDSSLILDKQEWQHIDVMTERFPYLRDSFESALAVPTEERYEWAVKRLENLPRTGYAFRGIPDAHVETISRHIQEMKNLSCLFAEAVLSKEEEEIALKMIAVHDLPEAVTHDFHRHDPITKVEKGKLEASALKIILEQDPQGLQPLFHLYEAAAAPVAHWVKDLDYLQCMERTLQYQQDFPEVRANLEEFWDDAYGKPLNTAQGRKMLDGLLARRKQLFPGVGR